MELLSRISEIMDMISPRRNTLVPGKFMQLAALTAKQQMLYNNLYKTREKLERDEQALVDYAKINRRMESLRNTADASFRTRKSPWKIVWPKKTRKVSGDITCYCRTRA